MPNVTKKNLYNYQIYYCLKVKPSFHEKLFQKEKNELLLWIMDNGYCYGYCYG